MKCPLTGKRLSICGSSEQEVIGRCADVHSVRRLLRHGAIRLEEARRRLFSAAHQTLMFEDCWTRHSATRPEEDWRKKLEGYWRLHLVDFHKVSVHAMTGQKMAEWYAGRLRYRNERTGHPIEPKTIWNVFDALKAAVTPYVESRLLEALPWGAWTPPAIAKGRPREALRTGSEFEAMVLEAWNADARIWARRQYADLAFRLAIMVLFGLRNGELAALGWADFSADCSDVLIRYQAKRGWRARNPEWERPKCPTKYRKERQLKVGDAAREILAMQRRQLELFSWYDPEGPVFPNPKTGDWRLNPNAIRASLTRKLWRAAGLTRPDLVVTHGLRHSFATLESGAGQSIKSIQAGMGHGSARVTEGYIHETTRELPGGNVRVSLPAMPEIPALPPGERAARPRALPAPMLEERPLRRGELFALELATWDAAGRPGKRPEAITREGDRRYRKARIDRLRDLEHEQVPSDAAKVTANKHATKVRTRFLDAWTAFVKKRGRIAADAAPAEAAEE